LISEFIEDLKVQFIFACATSNQIMSGEERSMSVISFVSYGLIKKIRFKFQDIEELLDGRNEVKLDDFLNLMILASCGGERTKLGLNNFTKLMKHLGIKQVV
jgi:hypothetical protein